jgi:predicted dehydrogenase
MNIGIVGCGLIGNKRARALGTHRLRAVADVRIERARELAGQHPECEAFEDWRRVVEHPEIDLVIASTTNDQLAAVTIAAVQNGKHVLVEKPAARNSRELEAAIAAARGSGRLVKVGFNLRFHPAIAKAKEIFDSGVCGPLMFLRARYGHGGRLGMEKEWRGRRDLAGGGEMLDQGIHLIDLSRWFAGDFTDITGHLARYFWDWEVEDNGFALLRTPSGVTAMLHASCTEWKNLFSMEIYGRTGKLQIDGLGGSYGIETLTHYRMLPQMGPPEVETWSWPGPDDSWSREMEYFVQCIETHAEPIGNLKDALAAMTIVEALERRTQKAEL